MRRRLSASPMPNCGSCRKKLWRKVSHWIRCRWECRTIMLQRLKKGPPPSALAPQYLEIEITGKSNEHHIYRRRQYGDCLDWRPAQSAILQGSRIECGRDKRRC